MTIPIRIQNSSSGDIDYRGKNFRVCIPGYSIGEKAITARIPDACLKPFLREMRRFPFIRVDVLGEPEAEENMIPPAPEIPPDPPAKKAEPEQTIEEPEPVHEPAPEQPEEPEPIPARDDFLASVKAKKIGENKWIVTLPDGREFETEADHHKRAKGAVYDQLYGGKPE